MDVMNKTDKTCVIIHGHFYQPPRENPWSGVIPRQLSAAPFHDWNHKITAECYAANTSSRRLDPHGSVVGIDNNYQGISFNFGPTLLSWLEEEAPHTYKKILEADHLSCDLFGGHGNALCQAYNHTILPLAEIEDIRIQVRWGIDDFKRRFQRDPEGIWLPETAINEKVVDILLEEGIHFTVLSPFQAEAMRPEGESSWSVLPQGAPCDRAFKLKGNSGDLAVFFYHPGLASGISFQHYLRDADQLFGRFEELARKEQGNLISVATDGEIYGHHEAFGDMCLASLIRKMGESDHLELSNWGSYLEKNPPTWEIKLKKGEDHRGTSWSCHHGVSRWYKDCHCETGGKAGWNQRWRGPLRQAFERLNREIMKIYSKEVSSICSTDPLELRRDYGKVLAGLETRETFLKKHASHASNHEGCRKILNLLEGQKYAQFMFTSCGWFFAELSGIEPIQNMKYAARAIELYQPYTDLNLQQLLSAYLMKAKSNVHEKGNGWELYREEALTESQHITRTVAQFVFQEIYGIQRLQRHGSFHFHQLLLNRNPNGQVEGSLLLELPQTQEEFTFRFYLESSMDEPESLRIEEEKDGRVFVYKLKNLPQEIREKIYKKKRKDDLHGLKNYLAQSYQQLIDCYRDHQRILPEGDPLTQVTLDSALNLTLAGILEEAEEKGLSHLSQKDVEKLDDLFHLSEDIQQSMENYVISLCSRIIADEVEYFLEYKNMETIERLYLFIQILWKHQLTAIKPYTQNLVFQVFQRENPRPWVMDFLKDEGENRERLLLDVVEKLAQIANIHRSVLIQEEDLQII